VTIVGASLSESVAANCHPSKPVSVLILQGSIDATVYFSCAEGSEVRGHVVNGGGHIRSGGTQYLPAVFIGATTRNVDGSELIWDFLSRHSR
jgi:poly(3-hydroxybutyrate) depolymerase